MEFAKEAYITRKQVNVIYSNAKNGKIAIERGFMSSLYNATEPSIWRTEDERSHHATIVRSILDAIFATNYEDAQRIISEEQTRYFSLLGKKGIASYSKDIVR